MGGGVAGGGDDASGLDAKIIGAIIGATIAVGSAIVVICTPSETLQGILHGGRNPTKTETSCDNNNQQQKITFKDSVPCVNISKRMAQCLESNCYDIKNCIAYFDLLKECENAN